MAAAADPPSPSSPTGEPLTRLPGRAARFRVDGSPGGTLWLAPHHLLQVQSGVLREGYRRFAYRDVQSIGVRRTARGLFYNLILGGVAGLFGLIAVLVAVSSASSAGGLVVSGGLAGFCLALIVVNVLRGPTVRCDLRTAVGLYPLPSLSRMGPAQRALELIRQRVEAAQGELSRDVLAEQVARLSQPPVGAAAPPTTGVYP